MYKIGDSIWYAHFNKSVSVTQKCPVCFGNLEVILILGDETHVKLPCNYCGHGYEEPSGFVKEHERVIKTEHRTIDRIDSQNIEGKESFEYFYTGYSDGHSYASRLDIDRIFSSEAEANAKCKELIEEDEKQEFESAKYLKHNDQKSYSWNAGYHMRIVKTAKKDIEYHTRKAEICKQRAKT